MIRDISGRRFGRWTAVSGRRYQRKTLWLCLCDCGNRSDIPLSNLIQGKSKSCGCLANELSVLRGTKHGHAKRGRVSATYRCWRNMISRCADTSDKDYGGRGITVCERWLSYKNFLEDMGEKPSGLTIERMNNDAGYNPQNCCWATRSQNNSNRRRWSKRISMENLR